MYAKQIAVRAVCNAAGGSHISRKLDGWLCVSGASQVHYLDKNIIYFSRSVHYVDRFSFNLFSTRRQEEITTEREEIDRQKKLLLKKRPSNDSGRKRNANPPGSVSMHNGKLFVNL